MYESLSWEDFKTQFRWKQGEHVTATAPTGAGKTTLFSELMPYRGHSIMFGTKKTDPMYDFIVKKRGFRRIQDVDEIRPWDTKVLLWPSHRPLDIAGTKVKQAEAFRKAMNTIMHQGNWTVWADEAKYMSEQLRLSPELTFLMEQARSAGVTMINGAQRPAWLSRSVLANSTHVFLWKTLDAEDAKRFGDIGGVDRREVIDELKTLGKHEFLYIKTRGTETNIYRSQVERTVK